MKILFGYRQDWRADKPVESYAKSMHRVLETVYNIQVTPVGEGHAITSPEQVKIQNYDLFLEVECGRNSKGVHVYFQPESQFKIPTAVWFIDSHGNPSLHKRLAPFYDHVFFAVWSKRDIFHDHSSAHFCPNATDLKWFGYTRFGHVSKDFDFGFFGSKGGLPRANPMIKACEVNGWSYDVRQVGKSFRHKWPYTGQAMAACKYLFNHGQKHDINLRIFESMAMRRPLLNDLDPKSGIEKLFVPGFHFIPYESYTYADLEEKMKWIVNNPKESEAIAWRAYDNVRSFHTIGNRVKQILEVVR